MSGLLSLPLAEIIGTIAGLVGVSLAVYLQLLNRRDVSVHYVVGFFVAGSALILMNPEAWLAVTFEPFITGARLLGAVLALVVELVAAAHVWATHSVESPTELCKGLRGTDRERDGA